MKRKKIVVALGHKALGTTLPEQKAAVKRSAKVIADLVAAGADVVITSFFQVSNPVPLPLL